MAGNAREPGRSVLSRVAAVLAAYDDDHLRLSLSDLAERSGLALSSTHRLAAQLAREGWLRRHDDATYSIGLTVFELGTRTPAYAELRRTALPYLTELAAETGENVQLAVLDGYEVLYIERLVGRRSVPLVSHPGSRLPLHATGVGKALLAARPEAFVRDYLSRPMRRFTSHTITTPGGVSREIAAIRRRGFAVTKEEMSLGSYSVACALDAGPAEPAAVGVTVRRISRTPEAMARRLRSVVDAIHAALGSASYDVSQLPP